jgi:hypothetical protein
MRSRFDSLIAESSKEFSEVWSSIAKVPNSLKPVIDKDAVKPQYWEFDKVRSDLRYRKSSILKRLSEIQRLINNPEEIYKLITTSDESFTEALGKGIVKSAVNTSNKGINWSRDVKIQRAKSTLERLYESNKNLPQAFDEPTKKLNALLEPLEKQLEWHEKSQLTDSTTKLADTVWKFGSSLVSQISKNKGK